MTSYELDRRWYTQVSRHTANKRLTRYASYAQKTARQAAAAPKTYLQASPSDDLKVLYARVLLVVDDPHLVDHSAHPAAPLRDAVVQRPHAPVLWFSSQPSAVGKRRTKCFIAGLNVHCYYEY